MIKNRYRAKMDFDGDTEVQVKYWYFPFLWLHIKYVSNLDRARVVVENIRQAPVEL